MFTKKSYLVTLLALTLLLYSMNEAAGSDGSCTTCGQFDLKNLYDISPRWNLLGQSGAPRINWPGAGQNINATSGPVVIGMINGEGRPYVSLGNGASYVDETDFYLPLNGTDWLHQRTFSTQSSSSLTWQGEGWWGNEMMNLSVGGTEGASDVDIEMGPHNTLQFTYSGGSWTCDNEYLYFLSFSSGDDEYTLTANHGKKYVFHDSQATNAGKLKRIEDPYGNDWAFTYSSGKLTDIVVDVIQGSDYKITYTSDQDMLQYIKVYKSTTTTDANLIGQIEYIYHDSTSDDYGSEDDLMKVTVSRKATNDGDGSLSIKEKYYYRYYKGTYDEDTNPGTDHQVKYILLPENADRLNTDKGDPVSQSNADFEDYANVYLEYDSNGRVRETQERLPYSHNENDTAGEAPLTTTYAWTVNGGSPDLDTWYIHCEVDRNDDSKIIFDVNSLSQILTWVVQDEDDGFPTYELIWHFDYGTSGVTENRLTTIHLPSNCSEYSESSPYGVTLESSDGVIYEIDYDYPIEFNDYDGYPEKVQIKEGTSGSETTLFAYGRTISERPCLATSIIEYESSGEADGRTTTISHSFYDSGGDKVQLKEIDITYPSVSPSKNGPDSSAEEKFYYDKRTGALRWTKDGEGYVNFFAYDDETGQEDLRVIDVSTSSLLVVVDDNWTGDEHGDEESDDDVPFERTGSGTALNIDSSKTIDWLGRTRKYTDPGDMISYYVYKDDETRVYPAWDTTEDEAQLPIQVTKTDKDGRPEDILTLKTSVIPNLSPSDEPIGTETYGNSDMATRAVRSYDINGALSHEDRYHDFPASGDGTRYTNYYRTAREYDSMGRVEYTIEDVSDETTYDREQVTKYSHDYMGRRTKVEEGVSSKTHDITSGKPSLTTLTDFFYDDPNNNSTLENGEGDGNLSWIRAYYGTSAGEYNDTWYQYDWRNRRCITQMALSPHTLVKYDNLDRITATGTYSTTSSLSPGDDPETVDNSNRLDLIKTYYDEWGRIYKSETYDDPGTPAYALATYVYYDRRSLIWAYAVPNSGVEFIKYDGARRKTQAISGTQFDTNKYDTTSKVPDYPDDDEGIVELVIYTFDDAGNITKEATTELNHDDTNGMDTDGSDFITTYVYNWYDDAHRLTDTANYGTYNSSGWKNSAEVPAYGASAPTRSDTILVTTYKYNSQNRRYRIRNHKNIPLKFVFDKLGRVTQKEEADAQSDERITKYEYNGLDEQTKITADLSTDQVTEYVYEDSQNAHFVTKVKYPDPSTGAASSSSEDTVEFQYHADGTMDQKTDQNGTVLTYSYDAMRRVTEEEVTTVGSYTGGAASVDSAIRSRTWQYDDEGHVTYLTSHTDTTPDTTNWTDAANQIKYTYNAADRLTKEEQEEDGAVDGSTLAVEYSYGTDYSTGNYNRLNYIEYPNGRKIWSGYTHSGGASTYQDTINDNFSRPGQIANDSSGSIGDILAEYDFNGLNRMVRRVHDEASGAYGNDTRMDLWHGTSGEYAGLDRFGRIVDMKFTDFSGTATEFERRKYTYDRNFNRESIEHTLYKADSQSMSYDDLNRLTEAKRGILDSSDEVYGISEVTEKYDMDLLGNFTATEGGIKINSDTSSITHAVNQTNEITTLDRPNSAGVSSVIKELFTTSLNAYWTETEGSWSISGDTANVDSVSSDAILLADADLDQMSYEVEVTFPSSSSTNKAGLLFAHDGDDTGYAVVLDRRNDKLSLHAITNGSWGSALDSDDITISESTAYTIRVMRRQRAIMASVDGESTSFEYNASSDFGTGYSGLIADKTEVTFDDFIVYDMTARDPKFTRISGSATSSISSGQLKVEDSTHYAEVRVDNFYDDDYMVQVDVDLNSGSEASVWGRYVDVNNGYQVTLDSSGNIYLYEWENGSKSTLDSDTYTTSPSVTVKLKVNGTSVKAWVDGTLEIDATDSTISAGGVAFGGDQPLFDDLKVGYDNNSDDDIDDAGDDVILDEDFSSTSVTVSHDKTGNLIDDGTFVYVYDGWNQMVKVQASEDSDVVLKTAEFDGLGRRIKKVVTNSGDYDGTVVYLYDGDQIIETRDGSSNVVQQFVHGTQYIDELVMVRVNNKGELYIHQDANWNVIALTDLGGHVVERYVYRAYGEVVVHQETSYGDYDGDQDVDTSDRDALSLPENSPSGAERILDLDFDGDVDSTDTTLFNNNLVTGISRHPGRVSTGVEQPFGHQGLMYDPEISSYQNRHRQLYSQLRRFMQRDPMGYADGMNLYEYCGTNPLNIFDPDGLDYKCPSVNNEYHGKLPPTTTVYCTILSDPIQGAIEMLEKKIEDDAWSNTDDCGEFYGEECKKVVNIQYGGLSSCTFQTGVLLGFKVYGVGISLGNCCKIQCPTIDYTAYVNCEVGDWLWKLKQLPL